MEQQPPDQQQPQGQQRANGHLEMLEASTTNSTRRVNSEIILHFARTLPEEYNDSGMGVFITYLSSL